jgi:hypothetical protein
MKLPELSLALGNSYVVTGSRPAESPEASFGRRYDRATGRLGFENIVIGTYLCLRVS